ncbi:TetR/AcrR family transcriptional regulator [Halosquirtibacter xylanolyticus]|uniref:TetR/AcrR family transcriptional regulator n=1 Tax=Halosquirtibacter xylanolyticus TaxID=3374599 RepID=UPI003748513B|nr:TetR/AcrR family transcriptional regulator [Prolixibacteraceae bacterium]
MEESTCYKIIHKARELFALQGVANVTMSSIAKEAGVGRRTLYMYFSSKEHLYDSVVGYEVGIIYDAIKGVFDTSDLLPTVEVIRSYVHARFDAFKELIQKNPSIRHDFINDLPRVNHIRREFNENELSLLKSLITRELGKASCFCSVRVESMSQLIHIMLVGLEVPIIIQNFSNETRGLLDQCIEMITKSIKIK